MFVRGLQREFVTECPKTKKAAACDVTEITIVPKLFSRKRIAEMNLDKRNLNGQKGIAQCDAGVREATWIQDDEFDAVGGGLLDRVDEFMFGVSLKTTKVMSELRSNLNAAFFDVIQAGCAVDIGFTRTQQVQVGTV